MVVVMMVVVVPIRTIMVKGMGMMVVIRFRVMVMVAMIMLMIMSMTILLASMSMSMVTVVVMMFMPRMPVMIMIAFFAMIDVFHITPQDIHLINLFVIMMECFHVAADGLGENCKEEGKDEELTEELAAAMGAVARSMIGNDGRVHVTACIWFCNRERFVSHCDGFVLFSHGGGSR